jgi:Dual specificity phosphatase, catalytic domain
MIEISSNLFVGTDEDYETIVKHHKGWAVVHASREPYQQDLNEYGEDQFSTHYPDWIVAKRDNRLFLNLIEDQDPDDIPEDLIKTTLEFIDECLKNGLKVLIHSNYGISRSPAIGLLYIASSTDVFKDSNLGEAEYVFKKLYPKYKPDRGMKRFLRRSWHLYSKGDADNYNSD